MVEDEAEDEARCFVCQWLKRVQLPHRAIPERRRGWEALIKSYAAGKLDGRKVFDEMPPRGPECWLRGEPCWRLGVSKASTG
jgi:hypothetical protein